MTIGSILLGVALLVGVGLFVTRPIFVHDPQRRRRMSQRKALTLQKEAILTEIRALDFDYETGKVAEEEYRQGREAYVAEAAELLQRIDALDERFLDTEATPAEEQPAAEQPAAEQPAAEQPKVAGQPELEFDEIEAAIARRRGKAAPAAAPAPKATRPKQKAGVGSGQAGGGFCPQCGQPADPDDRFCAFCGHQLTEPQHA